jgi:hypothetical protein
VERLAKVERLGMGVGHDGPLTALCSALAACWPIQRADEALQSHDEKSPGKKRWRGPAAGRPRAGTSVLATQAQVGVDDAAVVQQLGGGAAQATAPISST